jgi:glutamate-5-semialdehyde dehydrogenase
VQKTNDGLMELIKMSITEVAAAAKSASIQLAAVKTDVKNSALAEIAKALKQRSAEIVSANQKDLSAAKKKQSRRPTVETSGV